MKVLLPLGAAVFAFLLLFLAWIHVTGSQVNPVRLFAAHGVYLFGFCVLALMAAYLLRFRWSRPFTIGLLAAPLLVLMIADLTFLQYFHSPFYNLYPHLPIGWNEATPAVLMQYVRDYVSMASIAIAAAVLALIALPVLAFGERNALLSIATLGAFLPVFVVITSVRSDGSHIRDWSSLTFEPPFDWQRLYKADRRTALVTDDVPAYLPPTIVLVIMESAGHTLPSSDGNMPLHDRLMELGGGADWVVFDNAVTNSNATNISIPSILTGAGSHESIDRLHTLPFVMDLAAARGYFTAFITASTLNWASFQVFFAAAHIDEQVSSETMGHPFINDLAADDFFAFDAAETILERPGRIFLTLYSMSLHKPFQETSRFDIPEALTDRLSRAIYIQEQGMAQLFDALRRANRLADALIVIVGDHGEIYTARPGGGASSTRPRLHSFRNGVLSPLFLMKLPRRLPPEMVAAARLNGSRLIAGVDIAPTLAHLLGTSLTPELRYSGHSLFDAVPPDRIAYSAATSPWRSWVKSAVAVSQGRQRLLCETDTFCTLYEEIDQGLVRSGQPGHDSPLFDAAIRNGQLRKVLAQIYRNHLALSKDPARLAQAE